MASNGINKYTSQDILDGFPEPVILINGKREIDAYNEAAAALFNLKQSGQDLSLSLRQPEILRAAEEVLAGNAVDLIEVSFHLNVRRDFSLHALPLGGRDEVDGAMLVLHDVTAAKSAEQMRVDFVANISHELRSPLSSLVGFIETLQSTARDDPPAQDRFLEIMDSEANRMSRLIDDLLSLFKVEEREFIPPEGEVDLGDLVKGIANSLSVRAGERNMDIRVEVETNLPRAKADWDELTIVIQNLLDNAVSYGRDGSPVTVNIFRVDKLPVTGAPWVAAAVNNQGDVIPSELLPRLTERFYRVDKGRSRAMGGTGLGLAIVKHIVNRHRGRLTIESTVKDGTTLTVFLPAIN